MTRVASTTIRPSRSHASAPWAGRCSAPADRAPHVFDRRIRCARPPSRTSPSHPELGRPCDDQPKSTAEEEEYHQRVSRQEVLSTLRAQQAVLHARFGVARLALFGSVARDEAEQDSDVDLLVEFDRPVGLFRFMELQSHLEDLLGCGVDLGTPQSLKPRIRDRVLAEAVHVV